MTLGWAQESSNLRVITTTHEVVDELRDYDPEINSRDPQDSYEIMFSLVNDSVTRPKESDDDGYTHAMKIIVAVPTSSDDYFFKIKIL